MARLAQAPHRNRDITVRSQSKSPKDALRVCRRELHAKGRVGNYIQLASRGLNPQKRIARKALACPSASGGGHQPSHPPSRERVAKRTKRLRVKNERNSRALGQ